MDNTTNPSYRITTTRPEYPGSVEGQSIDQINSYTPVLSTTANFWQKKYDIPKFESLSQPISGTLYQHDDNSYFDPSLDHDSIRLFAANIPTSNSIKIIHDQSIFLPNLLEVREKYQLDPETEISDSLKNNVAGFLGIFQSTISNQFSLSSSRGTLPPLYVQWLPDDSVLIEWIFADFRIGFSIGEETNDLGWYIVTNDKFDSVMSSGDLDQNNMRYIIGNLVNFALSYS